MVTLTRSAPAVAAPGTLIATDAENEAISLARQIMVEAYGSANSAQDLQSLLVPTLGSGEPGASVDSILYMDTEDDSLYLRTSKDPVVYRQIAGSGTAVETGPVLQQVYLFYTRPALTVPAVITTADAVTIPDSGDGLQFTLLDDVEIPGPIHAGIDFVTEWFGGVTVELGSNSGGELDVLLKTVHRFGLNLDKQFTHVRETLRTVSSNFEFNVDLSNFDTVSNFGLGSYQPPSGDPIEITATDIALPSRITYVLEFQLKAARGGARKVGNVNYINFRNPITRSYQIDNRMAGASGLIAGAAPYAFYRQHQIAPVIPDLPVMVPANVPLEVVLIPNYYEPQRIFDDRDIVQDWDGAVEITFDTGGVLEITQRWIVGFASGANFNQDRTFHVQVRRGIPVLIDLDLFSFRQLFQPGTFPAGPGGANVTITPDDLIDARPAEARLLLSLETTGGAGKAGNITELSVQGGVLTIYQLNVLTQPVEDAANLPFLRRTYIFYERPALSLQTMVNANLPIPTTGLDFDILRDSNDNAAHGQAIRRPRIPGVRLRDGECGHGKCSLQPSEPRRYTRPDIFRKA